jgi:DNA-binding transcriptional MerR regulator
MANPLGEGEPEYSIAAVSKLTGVSCHALRIWERRYGFPAPQRTASGHRRYAREQVEMLRRVSELSRTGASIGDVIGDLRAGRLALVPEAADARAQAEVRDLVARLNDGDLDGADRMFDHLAGQLDPTDLVARVIVPTLTEAGERWYRRDSWIYEERCVTGFLRRKLEVLVDAARISNSEPGRHALVGSVQGDRHEGGGLIANLLLERAGWRVINLGADLAVAEFAKAVVRFRPDALALSFILSRNVNKRFEELSKITGVPIIVGGRSILNYQSLARRHGLIPVVCPVESAIAYIDAELALWKARNTGETGISTS